LNSRDGSAPLRFRKRPGSFQAIAAFAEDHDAMKQLLPFLVAILLLAFFRWTSRGGGGKVGTRLRRSDWHCWQMAVREKEQELSELNDQEPKL
jgi:hypothetical protein